MSPFFIAQNYAPIYFFSFICVFACVVFSSDGIFAIICDVAFGQYCTALAGSFA